VTDARDLYGLPLDRFVAERRALAKALRGDGQREQAVLVAELRKPAVAAWAVNQLVRTQGRAVSSLFDAGDALHRTQSELLAGHKDAGALRRAAEDERAAVEQLTEAARGLLSSEGHELTQATLDRLSETLHAAALDEDARAQMRDGCLERPLRHVGLGPIGAGSASAAKAGPAPRSPRPDGRRAHGDRVTRARASREGAERERAETLKAAQKAEAATRRRAQRAAGELDAAQRRRDRAAASLSDAENALVAARAEAQETALAHRRAQDSLERG
jgi:hypothetical protein